MAKLHKGAPVIHMKVEAKPGRRFIVTTNLNEPSLEFEPTSVKNMVREAGALITDFYKTRYGRDVNVHHRPCHARPGSLGSFILTRR